MKKMYPLSAVLECQGEQSISCRQVLSSMISTWYGFLIQILQEQMIKFFYEQYDIIEEKQLLTSYTKL